MHGNINNYINNMIKIKLNIKIGKMLLMKSLNLLL